MSKIVEFPVNRKIKEPEEEQELVHEWMSMLREMVVDLDAINGVHPLYLKTFLKALGQDEVLKMGEFLGFSELHFPSEEELLDFIAQQYLAYLPVLTKRLPAGTLKLLKDMMAHEGRYNLTDSTLMPEIIDLIYLGMGFLIAEGDTMSLVLALDTMELMENVDWDDLKEQAEKNTTCLELVQGMMFCYGVMEKEEVLEVLEEVTDFEIKHSETLMMLFMQCNLGATFSTDGHLIWDNLVENPKYLYTQIQSRTDLKRKHYTKSQLLAYSSRPVTYTNNLTQWLQKGHRDTTGLKDQKAKILSFSKKDDFE